MDRLTITQMKKVLISVMSLFSAVVPSSGDDVALTNGDANSQFQIFDTKSYGNWGYSWRHAYAGGDVAAQRQYGTPDSSFYSAANLEVVSWASSWAGRFNPFGSKHLAAAGNQLEVLLFEDGTGEVAHSGFTPRHLADSVAAEAEVKALYIKTENGQFGRVIAYGAASHKFNSSGVTASADITRGGFRFGVEKKFLNELGGSLQQSIGFHFIRMAGSPPDFVQ